MLMSKIDADEPDEKPLDPEVEKVRQKMVRLLVVSIGIMIVGVMAVLAAVVYRIAAPGEETAAVSVAMPAGEGGEAVASSVALPDGFTVEHVALEGGHILFYGSGTNGERAFVFDIETGSLVAEIEVAR
jgi:hypothetical protein